MRMKSWARVRKAAKVEANGLYPRTPSPVAAPMSCCSAMNISKKRSGWALAKMLA